MISGRKSRGARVAVSLKPPKITVCRRPSTKSVASGLLVSFRRANACKDEITRVQARLVTRGGELARERPPTLVGMRRLVGCLVPEAGLEPAHPYGRGILSPLRLPISPLGPPGKPRASGGAWQRVASGLS